MAKNAKIENCTDVDKNIHVTKTLKKDLFFKPADIKHTFLRMSGTAAKAQSKEQ